MTRPSKPVRSSAAHCSPSAIAHRIAEKRDFPASSAATRGRKLIPVPFWIAGKLPLFRAMREQEITNSEPARRIGVRETVVRRMLDPDHATKSEKLQAALAALGKQLTVSIDDAA